MSYPAGTPLRHEPPWRIESRRVAPAGSPLLEWLGAMFGVAAMQVILANTRGVLKTIGGLADVVDVLLPGD